MNSIYLIEIGPIKYPSKFRNPVRTHIDLDSIIAIDCVKSDGHDCFFDIALRFRDALLPIGISMQLDGDKDLVEKAHNELLTAWIKYKGAKDAD